VSNKAFALITSVGPAGDGTHFGGASASSCVVLDSDNNVVSTIGGSVQVDHSDNSHSILDGLADNIRTNNSDPNLVVIFVGLPGRY